MRNKIFGFIGMAWGGLSITAWIFSGMPMGGNAYGSGQLAGLIISALMLAVGTYYFFKKPADQSTDD